MMRMITKHIQVVTYHERALTSKINLIMLSLKISLQNHYIFTTRVAIELGKIVTYLDLFLFIKSHDISFTRHGFLIT